MWSTGRNVDEKFSWQLKTGGVHRSQSLGAGDAVAMPPSHRRHRMQYLANRSLFEREAPSEPPPPPPVQTKPPLKKQTSFSLFVTDLLNNQAHVHLVDGSLPPLKIVEEPLCRRTHVHRTTSSVVDSIDYWQPKWLDSDIRTYGMDGERADRSKVKRSNSDAGYHYQGGFKPTGLSASRKGWGEQGQVSGASISRSGKTVRDLAESYQTAVVEKSKPPPVLGRRSSMSAMPVKVLAKRFSIPNE